MVAKARGQVPDSTITLAAPRKVRSYFQLVFDQFLRNRIAVAGAVVLLTVILVVLIGPLFIKQDAFSMNLGDRLLPASWDHPLGTDLLGRDMLERLILGGRVSLLITSGAVALAVVVGSLLGVVSGYYAGTVDFITMRLVDVLMTLPGFLLAIGIVAALGVGTLNVILAVGIAAVPAFARISRGSTLSVRSQEYVEAARAIGVGTPRILYRHVLPNIVPPLIVQTTLQLATAMLTASGLSFLGLGPQPPTPEWGAMLAEGRDLITNAPALVVYPGLTILLVAVCFNLVGDGLRDAVDPYLRR
jgi:peptide/nickel transport system permease protein